MKLKTFKNINGKSYSNCKCKGDYIEGCLSCLRRDSREEAKKWVKKYKKDREKGNHSLHEKQNLYYREITLIDFFNLGEEDLE